MPVDDEDRGRHPGQPDRDRTADEADLASEGGPIHGGERSAVGFGAILVGCLAVGAFIWWTWKVASALPVDPDVLRPSGGELGQVVLALFLAFLLGLWWMRPNQSAVALPIGLALLGLFVIVAGTGVFLPRSGTYVSEGGAPVARDRFVSGPYEQIIHLETSTLLVGAGILLLSLALIAAVVRARDLVPPAGPRLVLVEGWVVTATVAVLVIAKHFAVTPGWTVVGGRRARRRVVKRHERAATHDDVAAVIWHRAHAEEAESVFAFEDLRLQLAELGAPSSLLLRCHRAASDERRHALLTRGLVEELGGTALPPDGPAPRRGRRLPIATSRLGRRIEIGRLAFESYTDGVVGEGFAASQFERASHSCPDARRASILKSIARDERRHQALSADVVRWCHEQEPTSIRVAVKVAAALVPRRSPPTGDRSRLSTGAAREAGLVDGATWSALWTDARQDAVYFSSALRHRPV